MSELFAPTSSLPLLLVDGSSYLYRAFHAMPPLTTSKGQPTGAVRGVINMLKRLAKDYPNSPITVIFDAKGKTFRDDIYSDYKANRPSMPDDLRAQIEPLHAIIKAMGLPLIIEQGVEADDVIGTYAAQATKQDRAVVVSTGDKDMAQLVNEHITLVNTMTETVMDTQGVEDKFGLPPSLIIDYLALMGDKVDNIPGVPGVGEKTALALLQNIGSIDTIYNNLDKIADLTVRGAKSLGKKLAEHKDKADLSYTLATIKCDVALGTQLDELVPTQPDNDALLALFEELEFKAWVTELGKPAKKTKAAAGVKTGDVLSDEAATSSENASDIDASNYEVLLEQSQLDTWINYIKQAKLIAFDTETTSLNYMEAKLVGMSFAVEIDSVIKAAYLPLDHDYLGAPKQLDKHTALAQLKPLLEDHTIAKVGQNLKYDRNILLNDNITLNGIQFDTMLESYVVNATANRHDMDTLSQTHLGHNTTSFVDIAGKGAKQLTFNQIPLEQAAPYAAEDADVTLRLHHVLWPQVQATPTLEELFNTLEMPLVPVISNIERNGALIDRDMLGKQSQELDATLKGLQDEAWALAGEEFNLSSPKQLGRILFEKLDIPVVKKTKTGAPSTAEEVLQELALSYELPALLLKHRGLAKLKSTYTDKLPKMVNPATGRLHTSYHQAVTATGRLSSTEPNLQNIPIKTEEGRRVRKAFIASPGYKIVAADYSQIELRIMAHLSKDDGLLDAFKNNLDVHSATAAEVFGVEIDDVTTEFRRSAKAINFGLIYGMSAFGLAKQLNIGRYDAQQYIDTYFERYPGVATYMDTIRAQAKEDGYVETLLGRRLYLPEINASNGMRRQAAERTAINAPMQGSAADIIKKAMIDVDAWLTQDNIDAKIIMQVHDELVLEVKEEHVESITSTLCKLMSNALLLDVPLLVEAGAGDNWDEAH